MKPGPKPGPRTKRFCGTNYQKRNVSRSIIEGILIVFSKNPPLLETGRPNSNPILIYITQDSLSNGNVSFLSLFYLESSSWCPLFFFKKKRICLFCFWFYFGVDGSAAVTCTSTKSSGKARLLSTVARTGLWLGSIQSNHSSLTVAKSLSMFLIHKFDVNNLDLSVPASANKSSILAKMFLVCGTIPCCSCCSCSFPMAVPSICPEI